MRFSRSFFTPELGAKLKALRARAGLSQAEAARRMGLSYKSAKSFICELEQGRIEHPYLETIVRYLIACGALMDEFFSQFNALEPVKVTRMLNDECGMRNERAERIRSDTDKQVSKWQRKTAHPRRGTPIAPEQQRPASEKFRDYRLLVNVLEELLREEFADEPEVWHRRPPYFALARKFLCVVRRSPEPKRSVKLDVALDFARASGLDRRVAARIREFVVEFWDSWSSRNPNPPTV